MDWDVTDELDRARAGLDLVEGCAPGESAQVSALSTVVDATRITMIDALGLWDAQGRWGIDGCLSAEAWLCFHGGHGRSEATALVLVARLCHRYHAAGDALHGRLAVPEPDDDLDPIRRLCGPGPLRLSFAQLLVWARLVTPVRAALFVEHAPHVLAVCARLNLRDTACAAKRWAAAADDALDVGGDSLYDRRGVHISRYDDGAIHLNGVLDPHNGELLTEALEAMDRLDPADTPGGARGRPQRMADHLGELARQFLGRVDRPDAGSVASPAHTVLVLLRPGEGGIGETAEGSVISPDLTDLYSCTAWLSRIRFTPNGEVLDMSRRARLFTGAQTKAIIARDRHCQFPGCDRPPSWCDIHHVTHWQHGGPTDLANGVLICHQHHRLLHTRRWALEHNPEVPDGRSVHHRWRINQWPQPPPRQRAAG